MEKVAKHMVHKINDCITHPAEKTHEPDEHPAVDYSVSDPSGVTG